MDASGLFSSCVTESMNVCCRRTSRISRTRNTLNSTTTLMMTTKKPMPADEQPDAARYGARERHVLDDDERPADQQGDGQQYGDRADHDQE